MARLLTIPVLLASLAIGTGTVGGRNAVGISAHHGTPTVELSASIRGIRGRRSRKFDLTFDANRGLPRFQYMVISLATERKNPDQLLVTIPARIRLLNVAKGIVKINSLPGQSKLERFQLTARAEPRTMTTARCLRGDALWHAAYARVSGRFWVRDTRDARPSGKAPFGTLAFRGRFPTIKAELSWASASCIDPAYGIRPKGRTPLLRCAAGLEFFQTVAPALSVGPSGGGGYTASAQTASKGYPPTTESVSERVSRVAVKSGHLTWRGPSHGSIIGRLRASLGPRGPVNLGPACKVYRHSRPTGRTAHEYFAVYSHIRAIELRGWVRLPFLGRVLHLSSSSPAQFQVERETYH